jgi:hypothetical protein
MREKTARIEVVDRYIDFLQSVKINGDNKGMGIMGLIATYQVNKTARKALIDLAIIDYENDLKWNWLSFEPSKPLALSVLNYLLERSKKSRATVIAGLEETNAVLRQLSEMVSTYVSKRESGLKQPIVPSNGNLFSEVDTKSKERFEMAKSIASGVFKDWESINDYQSLGHRIITATDHILELLNKK